jgi:hypothetical protein
MESSFCLDASAGFEQLFAVSFDYERYARELGEEMQSATYNQPSLENVQLQPQEWETLGNQVREQPLNITVQQNSDGQLLPEIPQATEERVVNNVPSPQQSLEDPLRTLTEITMFRDIEDVKRKIKEQKAAATFEPHSEACLELKLRKAQLYIRKKQFYATAIGETLRDKEHVQLQLEEVCFQRDLRKAQNKNRLSPVDLDDDEEYIGICSRRFELQKELQSIGDRPQAATPQTVNPGPSIEAGRQRYY